LVVGWLGTAGAGGAGGGQEDGMGIKIMKYKALSENHQDAEFCLIKTPCVQFCAFFIFQFAISLRIIALSSILPFIDYEY
jgi:hypothetical protein